MTLGNAAAAHVRLIVWCKDCRHQVEPDTAEMVERYGAETAVPGLGREAGVRQVRKSAGQDGGEWGGAVVSPRC
jgi:hypothetical protein